MKQLVVRLRQPTNATVSMLSPRDGGGEPSVGIEPYHGCALPTELRGRSRTAFTALMDGLSRIAGCPNGPQRSKISFKRPHRYAELVTCATNDS